MNKKNDKKNNYKFLVAGLVIILIISIAILVIALTAKTPENAINGMLNSLKTGDFDKARDYMDYDELLSNAKIVDTEEIGTEEQKLLFNRLDWKILNISKNGNSAEIQIEIKNKDFKTVFTNYFQKVLKAALKKEEVGEKILIEELKSDGIQTTTMTTTIKTEKHGGNWNIIVDENLKGALLPGVKEAINTIK